MQLKSNLFEHSSIVSSLCSSVDSEIEEATDLSDFSEVAFSKNDIFEIKYGFLCRNKSAPMLDDLI